MPRPTEGSRRWLSHRESLALSVTALRRRQLSQRESQRNAGVGVPYAIPEVPTIGGWNMNKRRIGIVAALILLALILGGLVVCRVMGLSFSTGRIMRTQCGDSFLLLNGTPVELAGKDDFGSLQTGDKVLVLHGLIRETYPSSTDAHVLLRLKRGSRKDIPARVINDLDSLGWVVADTVPENADLCAKPVIYLYPEETREVTVKLSYSGTLTTTYPEYREGWHVTAQPDGTLLDPETGREYYCMFWEGVSDTEYDFSTGFVVPGEETVEFLEDALKKLGLNDREAEEFIIYWLPKMEGNPYNLISFQQERYTDSAKLEITPEPDTLIRVFMAWKPLSAPVEIPEQTLTAPARQGFTAVEWGGTEIK